MNILVCVKQVQDNAIIPKLDSNTNRVIKDGIETMMSPFDQNAVEAGIQLVETHGGEVTVITLGDDTCRNVLKLGLSMGADNAILVSDNALEESDNWATSYALAKAIQHAGPYDLIICGKQAIDSDSAQVATGIAGHMDIPVVTYINSIIEVTDSKIVVQRVSATGEEIIEATLPAILSCEKTLNVPRYPTLKKTRKANRAEIPVLDCVTIGADIEKVGAQGSPSKILKLYTPEPRQSGEVIKGVAAEVAKIAVQKILDLKVI